MKRPGCIKISAIALLLQLLMVQQVPAQDASDREYQIKAAFLYNFLKFVQWPEQKSSDANEPIVVGIIGKNVFGDALEELGKKKVAGRKVVVKKFKGMDEIQKGQQEQNTKPHPDIEAIRKSHLLFICPSEKNYIKNILNSVKDHGVLTVADTEGFLETGGIINLLTEKQKINFEINLIAAKQAGIEIRSQLLRLAKRTIRDEEE